jgi:CubicO group peptidase (beta-lactamase class C family)
VAPDTLFWAASTAKGVASAVAHVLVERGELAYDLRAVDVWPEFGAHGKDQVTLRHVLLHIAGVPAPPYDTTVEELCNWDHMCAVLAEATPWWEPGSRFGHHAKTFGYHAKTFGFLLGEIVRRATGRTLSAWLREAVTVPLGVGDEVHFGVPEGLLDRVARQQPPIGPPLRPPAPGSPLDRAIPPGIRSDAGYANRRDVLTADIPSEGTMSARGAALLYARCLATSTASTWSHRLGGRTWRRCSSRVRTRSWGSRRRGRSALARNGRVASRPGPDRPSAWWG